MRRAPDLGQALKRAANALSPPTGARLRSGGFILARRPLRTPTLAGGQEAWRRAWDNSRPYRQLMRLSRFEDLALLLLPGAWGLWFAADGPPAASVLAAFVAAAFFMRCAAWTFNDLAEGKVLLFAPESLVARGVLGPRQAAYASAALVLLAALPVALLRWEALLWGAPALLVAVAYPWVKLRSYLAQGLLGAGVAWAVPVAFALQGSAMGKTGWLLFVGTLLWATACHLLYAVPRSAYEAKVGIRSMAQLFGMASRPMALVLQLLALAALWLVGRHEELGPFFAIGLLTALALLGHQQFILREGQGGSWIRAYRANIWLGLAVFCGIAFHFLCLGPR